MTITLGLNISSLKSQRQLSRSSDELSNVFTRLSSGQRINRASDDAAGLAIADSLNADSRVYNQGVRNLNDGISVLNIADGALQELTNITFRLTELAEQAANGTLGTQQRGALDEEAQALKAEYFRIAKSTEYNGKKLFEGEYGVLSLQAGYSQSSILSSGLGGAIGNGEFTLLSSLDTGDSRGYSFVSSTTDLISSADFNGDGNLDLASVDYANSSVKIFLGNGTGSFTESVSFAASQPTGLSVGDFDGDGNVDLVYAADGSSTLTLQFGNGDGTFRLSTTDLTSSLADLAAYATDLNGDGLSDIVAGDSSGGISILYSNGDGTFRETTTYNSGSSVSTIDFADLNNDGITDILIGEIGSSQVNILLGDGEGSYTATVLASGQEATTLSTGDINGDGFADMVTSSYASGNGFIFLSNGDGTFQAGKNISLVADVANLTLADLNGDGKLDIITSHYSNDSIGVFLGNGDGTFQNGTTYSAAATSGSHTVADFNNDGVLDIVTSGNYTSYGSVLLGDTEQGVAPLLDFSLKSIADAKHALSRFQQKLEQLTRQRGQIGAFQSRIEVAERVLSVSAENFKAAESRVRDADIAQESADLVRLNILQQAASAVLGQANQQPQLVLQLLGGNK